MDPTEKHFTPAEGGIDLLSRDEAERHLENIPDWTLNERATGISRLLKTNDFPNAQAAANQAGDVAEQEDHHPDIRFGYG